jgi:exonuclease III
VIVSTINVNGIRAGAATRHLASAAYALRWSDHAPVTVEYLG